MKDPKHCLGYLVSENVCENVLSTENDYPLTELSQPRVEFLRADNENKSRGNNLFENMKVVQNMRSLLAA